MLASNPRRQRQATPGMPPRRRKPQSFVVGMGLMFGLRRVEAALVKP